MLHIPTKLQEKYNFLIKEPHGLDQVSCSKLLMTRLLENGLKVKQYFGLGIHGDEKSNNDYTDLSKIAKGQRKPFKDRRKIIDTWISHSEKEMLINIEDIKKHHTSKKINQNEDDSDENIPYCTFDEVDTDFDKVSEKEGKVRNPEGKIELKINNGGKNEYRDFEWLWDRLSSLHQEGQVDISLIKKDIKKRLFDLIPRALHQNKFKGSMGITPYVDGNSLVEFIHDFDTSEITDLPKRKLIEELMGIFDKLVGAVNGPFKHFFSGNEEKARLKSRALKIVNELNVSGIKISLNRCLKNWTLNSPPIMQNYVPHKELEIIPVTKDAIKNKNDILKPDGDPSFRFNCNIQYHTIFDLRFGNKEHYKPNEQRKYEHVIDEHLIKQLDELITNLKTPPFNNMPNNPKNFVLKTVK